MFERGTLTVCVAHVFSEDNYDIDQVIGVQNIRVQDPAALGALAWDRLGAEVQQFLGPDVFMVGARNFGYGHPHVQSLTAIRHLGVIGIIADSFTPAFWRGGVSNGFLLITCPGISAATAAGDMLEFDWRQSLVRNGHNRVELPFKPHTAFERRMLEAGGIVPLLAQDGDKLIERDTDE